jgi:hypothetical protein
LKRALCLLTLLYGWAAQADIVTEFGAGVKLPASTSVLLLEDCHLAQVIETRPDRPDLDYRLASCGGDDPMFMGWPIAYEWTSESDIWSVRGGWFHFSHWFDGGGHRETHLDCGCVSATFNWTAWRKHRASK